MTYCHTCDEPIHCPTCDEDDFPYSQRTIHEIHAEIKKLEESGEMEFGDQVGSGARGWQEALLWILGKRKDGWP